MAARIVELFQLDKRFHLFPPPPADDGRREELRDAADGVAHLLLSLWYGNVHTHMIDKHHHDVCFISRTSVDINARSGSLTMGASVPDHFKCSTPNEGDKHQRTVIVEKDGDSLVLRGSHKVLKVDQHVGILGLRNGVHQPPRNPTTHLPLAPRLRGLALCGRRRGLRVLAQVGHGARPRCLQILVRELKGCSIWKSIICRVSIHGAVLVFHAMAKCRTATSVCTPPPRKMIARVGRR